MQTIYVNIKAHACDILNRTHCFGQIKKELCALFNALIF